MWIGKTKWDEHTDLRREGEADGYMRWRRDLRDETAASNFCFFPNCLCSSSNSCLTKSSDSILFSSLRIRNSDSNSDFKDFISEQIIEIQKPFLLILIFYILRNGKSIFFGKGKHKEIITYKRPYWCLSRSLNCFSPRHYPKSLKRQYVQSSFWESEWHIYASYNSRFYSTTEETNF